MTDDRIYKIIKLQNNLEALLISDIKTPKSAASICVGVGSYYNDLDSLGLAHYLEHMIFLGSKSYPQPSQFETYLNDNMGGTNAYTAEETTTFFFDVNNQGLENSLMMFSRMFAEPLFDKNYMNKEINAVNSENEKNLNSEFWRHMQVLKTLADPNDPFSKFSTGNNQTLRTVDLDTLHLKLEKLYNDYYLPENMKLVILSNYKL